jgi:hypothetical protein
MRNLLMLFIFVPIISLGQKSGFMKVKLIDFSEDKIPAYCGHMAFATTLKFRLINDFDSLKSGQDILVIIPCPREFGIENFINNQIYRLKIYGNSKEDNINQNSSWTIWYRYTDKLPTFWLKELKKNFNSRSVK